jgi:hypothetical protein
MISRTFGAPAGGTTRGGHQGFESLALSLMTPPNAGGGRGSWLPGIVVVALGEPRNAGDLLGEGGDGLLAEDDGGADTGADALHDGKDSAPRKARLADAVVGPLHLRTAVVWIPAHGLSLTLHSLRESEPQPRFERGVGSAVVPALTSIVDAIRRSRPRLGSPIEPIAGSSSSA